MINFSEKYDRKKFESFLKDFLPEDLVLENKELEINDNEGSFSSASLLGSVYSLNELVIIEVKRKKPEKSRLNITKKLFKFLELHKYSKALIITFSELESHYRFSLVTSELKWVKDTSVERFFSNPKRLSFLLGENKKLHTPQNKLKKKVTNYNDLYSRFDIEIVSEEFFQQYKQLYINICETLKKDHNFLEFIKLKKIKIPLFTKKLLGQIVFCYFLQEKGCLGANKNTNLGSGNKDFLRNEFDKIKKDKLNYYNDFLEFLFYEGLNKENKNNFVEKINCKVPYLNGGLFEEIEDYKWKNEFLKISNDLFTNKSKTGILDLFDLYNFTVDESDDFDVEIGIDPEMLGKVFENLLPENFKAGKGSFYTPKKIVSYMSKESLKNFLVKKNDLKNHNIIVDQLINFNKAEIDLFQNTLKKFNNVKLINKINDYLENIKICDPAIGSGAFPVQLMNDIVFIRFNILNYLKRSANIYTLKRNFIENSIYGVDIDNGAIDISKLRLWLSLIVEEEDINYINPLPNLDYKIIQGNSLIQKFEDYNFNDFKDQSDELFEDENIKVIKNELIDIQKKYFNLKNINLKNEYKKKLDEKIQSLITHKTKIINKKDLLLNNNEKNFFLWKIFFLDIFEKGGFDIVIGNPPYVFARYSDSKGLTKVDKEYYYKNYDLIDFKINYYLLFIELSSKILKVDGSLSFIIPNNWMTISTNTKIRQFILSKSNVKIINCKSQVFQAANVDASILFFSNKNEKNSSLDLLEYEKEKGFMKIKSTNTAFIKDKNYIINFELLKNEKLGKIFYQIEDNSKKIYQTAFVKQGVIAYGIGGGKPLQTKKMKDDEVYHSFKKIDINYLKFLESNDIHRYFIDWTGRYLKYGDNLFRKREFKIFKNTRILVKQIPSKPPYCISATITTDELINDSNSIIIHDIQNYDALSLLGILNSKLVTFWFILKFGKLQRKIFPQFKINELEQFPLPAIEDQNKKDFLNLTKEVKKILSTKKENEINKINFFIDEIVYKLFKITPKDIDLINKYLSKFNNK